MESPKIKINNIIIPVEIKISPMSRSKGMMGRTHLNGGMLFMFDHPSQQSFWMKNCLIKLDIIFIDQGKINKIHHSCSPCDGDNCETYEGYGDMVLELNSGESKRLNLSVGDEVRLIP